MCVVHLSPSFLYGEESSVTRNAQCADATMAKMYKNKIKDTLNKTFTK